MKRIIAYTLLFLFNTLLHAFPITECDTTWYTGEGTQYGGVAGSNGGNCGIYVPEDEFLHCAMNHTQYDSSYACGACVRVFGPLGEITVKVVDRCPECKHGDIDFSTLSFLQIATLEAGRVPIKWQFVPCEEEKNIKVKFEEGTSQFYFKAIFYDIKYRINKVEYQRQDGTFVPIHREMYNFYVENGGIDEDKSKIGPYIFRLTSSEGDTLTTDPVEYVAGKEIDLGIQFPHHDCGDGEHNEQTLLDEPIKAGIPTPIKIEVYDLAGRRIGVFSNQAEFESSGNKRKGFYLIKEIGAEGEIGHRLIKE